VTLAAAARWQRPAVRTVLEFPKKVRINFKAREYLHGRPGYVDLAAALSRWCPRRVEGKILIPVSAVRRFAREDHPDSVRTAHVSDHAKAGRHSSGSSSRFQPQSEGLDDAAPRAANTHRAF
jgi:hypothetical protein